ncbi:DNA-3-methyladenine glycosylase family protein [Aromatoleum sp.]|uniref:DNA-3-methyladenine glycosylase family protein n=1 Tax=Aromatoleum sp. TaxID=2307007 RepID=UPI002FC7AB08
MSTATDTPFSLTHPVELPADFSPDAILAFHGRDASGVAERVDAGILQKGLAWEGRAACLTIRFHSDHAEARLAIDGEPVDDPRETFDRMLRRMLGLTQPVADFERAYRSHPEIGRLIAARPWLRVPVSPTPFEALTWAITGQQITVKAALSLRRKMIQAAGLTHSEGLVCYPDAMRLGALGEADFRAAGFSRTKALTLIGLGTAVRSGEIPLDAWVDDLAVDEIRKRLLNVRGIGPWTIDYTLLRGFGWLDGSLHGDVAVRRNLQLLLGAPEKITEDNAKRWLAQFSPWRALIGAHLWALKSSDIY